jgi:hypothetical protein
MALADHVNVKLAAEIAKVSTSQAYVRRNQDAAFRAGWDRALATGYAQLELALLERALHGVEKLIITRDGDRVATRLYSDRVGLALLRMHRDHAMRAVQAMEASPDAEHEEARDRIFERLERYVARATAEEWDEVLTFQTLLYGPMYGSRRKIVMHALLHGVRHWAQIAMALRQAGWPEQWPHDLMAATSIT